MTTHQQNVLLALHRYPELISNGKSYPTNALTRLLKVDARTLTLILRLGGWTKDRVRRTQNGNRVVLTFWTPPDGIRPKRRRKGRPSFFDLINYQLGEPPCLMN